MARIKDLIPMLGVADLERTVSFYVDTLGFTVAGEFAPPGRPRTWAHLRHGAASVFVTGPVGESGSPESEHHHGHTMLYFYPEGVEALRREMVARGAEPGELRVTHYGMKEFQIVDPDGYKLLFGEETEAPPTPET